MHHDDFTIEGDGAEWELRFHDHATDREALLDYALMAAFANGAACVVVLIAMDDSDFVAIAKARGAEFLPIQCGFAEVRFRRKNAAEKE